MTDKYLVTGDERKAAMTFGVSLRFRDSLAVESENATILTYNPAGFPISNNC